MTQFLSCRGACNWTHEARRLGSACRLAADQGQKVKKSKGHAAPIVTPRPRATVMPMKHAPENRRRQGRKVCRYNWHSAGSPGWPFPMLKYKYKKRICSEVSESSPGNPCALGIADLLNLTGYKSKKGRYRNRKSYPTTVGRNYLQRRDD